MRNFDEDKDGCGYFCFFANRRRLRKFLKGNKNKKRQLSRKRKLKKYRRFKKIEGRIPPIKIEMTTDPFTGLCLVYTYLVRDGVMTTTVETTR